LLEIRYREVVDFMLLQEGVDLHARCETKEPSKLGGREGPGTCRLQGPGFPGQPEAGPSIWTLVLVQCPPVVLM
jgi:hypothetical protein